MGYGASSFIIKWVNFLTLGVSFCVLGLGIWLSSKHGDCDKFLTVPVLILGFFMFIMHVNFLEAVLNESLLGFVGAWKDLVWLLCVYLVIMFFLLAGLAFFTAFAFVVTNEGAGRAVSGLRFKEYSLSDYSGYIRRLFDNWQNWKHLRDCLLNPEYCEELDRTYDSIQEFPDAQLNSIQSGCCRPPAECKFPMINVTYYNLTSRYLSPSATTNGTNPTAFPLKSIAATVNLTGPPVPPFRVPTTINHTFNTSFIPSTITYVSPYKKYNDPDCIAYDNDPRTMCFQCNSCKAGVAEYVKKDWRLVAVINIAIFVFLVALYTIGCCARRNASRAQYTKV